MTWSILGVWLQALGFANCDPAVFGYTTYLNRRNCIQEREVRLSLLIDKALLCDTLANKPNTKRNCPLPNPKAEAVATGCLLALNVLLML